MANRIREYREARGLTQADVARLLGVTESAVARWDRGEVNPRPRMAAKLAKRLGVSVDDLELD